MFGRLTALVMASSILFTSFVPLASATEQSQLSKIKNPFSYESQDKAMRKAADFISSKVNTLCEVPLLNNEALKKSEKKIVRALAVLMDYTAKLRLGWITFPHISPLLEVLKRSDKLYVTFQTMRTGVPIQLTAYVLFRLKSGDVGGLLHDWYQKSWNSLLRPYASYQFGTAIRSGVEMDSTKSKWTKIWQSSLLAISVYTIMDQIPKFWDSIFHGKSVDITSLEVSSLTYLSWTAFSVLVRVYLTTPLFAQVFPQKGKAAGVDGILERLEKSTSLTTELEKVDNELSALKQKISTGEETASKLNEIKSRVLELRAARFWFKWIRKGLKEGESVDVSRMRALQFRKDFTQWAVAITMLTGFLAMESYLKGDATDPGLYKRLLTQQTETQVDHAIVEAADPKNETYEKVETALIENADNQAETNQVRDN